MKDIVPVGEELPSEKGLYRVFDIEDNLFLSYFDGTKFRNSKVVYWSRGILPHDEVKYFNKKD